jgi:hypothetical protein
MKICERKFVVKLFVIMYHYKSMKTAAIFKTLKFNSSIFVLILAFALAIGWRC